MCAVSMIGDYYREILPIRYPQFEFYPATTETTITVSPSPTREEFDALKKEVLEMKELLKRAKAYDEATGQEDCEQDEKIALLRKVADLVGVDLREVFGS